MYKNLPVPPNTEDVAIIYTVGIIELIHGTSLKIILISNVECLVYHIAVKLTVLE